MFTEALLRNGRYASQAGSLPSNALSAMLQYVYTVSNSIRMPKYYNQTSNCKWEYSVIKISFTLHQELIRIFLLLLVSYVSITQVTQADQQAKL
jgi:hypothetical protein